MIPEIVELKPGCKLVHPDYHFPDFIVETQGTGEGSIFKIFTEKRKAFYSDKLKNGFISRNSVEVEDWKVVGRPIQLADVLQTISEKDRVYACISINELGLITWETYLHIEPVVWNFTKPLEQQTQIVIDFLHEIICPTKSK